MASGWGCPHEANNRCSKVNQLPCNPGMKGCVLAGRFRFVDEDKNARYREKQARQHSDRADDNDPPEETTR